MYPSPKKHERLALLDPLALQRASASRPGLTLLELLISMSLMALIVGALGVLARAVQMSSDYTERVAIATQQGRVALERISRAVDGATANENFPGAAVFADDVGSWNFPDTLVVWHPSITAANPTGLPLFSELIVFCPNPAVPNQLWEITVPSDSRQVPALTSTGLWQTELANLKANGAARRVLLGDMIRTAPAGSASASRGAVRFDLEQRPPTAQWQEYRAGTRAWKDIDWVQTLYGSQSGLAQTWVRIELQMMPSYTAASGPVEQVLPMLGSAAIYYQLTK